MHIIDEKRGNESLRSFMGNSIHAFHLEPTHYSNNLTLRYVLYQSFCLHMEGVKKYCMEVGCRQRFE